MHSDSDKRPHCEPCDEAFDSVTDLKDHVLDTPHNGPYTGTRNFKYKLTEKTAKSNLIRGAKREHFAIDSKQGATNIDFSDGSWILVAYPELIKWEKGSTHYLQ